MFFLGLDLSGQRIRGILEAIAEAISLSSIRHLDLSRGRLGADCEQFVNTGFTYEQEQVPVSPFDVDAVSVRITGCWFAVLSSALSQFGEVVSGPTRDKFVIGDCTIETDTRSVICVLSKSLPPFLQIGDKKVRVSHRGQEKTCFHCEGIGHIAKNCHNKTNQDGFEHQPRGDTRTETREQDESCADSFPSAWSASASSIANSTRTPKPSGVPRPATSHQKPSGIPRPTTAAQPQVCGQANSTTDTSAAVDTPPASAGTPTNVFYAFRGKAAHESPGSNTSSVCAFATGEEKGFQIAGGRPYACQHHITLTSLGRFFHGGIRSIAA